MLSSRITLVRCDDSDDRSEQRWRQAERHWLDADPLEFESRSLEELLANPGQSAPGVLIVAPQRDVSPASIFKLLDLAGGLRSAAVVLVEPGDSRFDPLRGDSVVVAPTSVAPETLAGSVYGLAARQGAIDALSAELRTSQRFQGGLRNEIDRMHDEMQLAASVQNQLLPDEMPVSPGMDFGVLFKPVGYVSGDIYDVRRIDERRIGFFLADAVGHGVPAALLTMVLRRGLQMTRTEDDGEVIVVPPAEALARLNATLVRGTGGSSRFATAVYGAVRIDTHEVVVASAGHPPPLRVLPSGEVLAVETDGCLLGVFPEADFNQSDFTLEPGETLLLYSDGFETAFPADEARRSAGAASASKKHLERFARLLGERGDQNLTASMRALATDVDEQTGSLHQQDDLTALALARLAEGAATAPTGAGAGEPLQRPAA